MRQNELINEHWNKMCSGTFRRENENHKKRSFYIEAFHTILWLYRFEKYDVQFVKFTSQTFQKKCKGILHFQRNLEGTMHNAELLLIRNGHLVSENHQKWKTFYKCVSFFQQFYISILRIFTSVSFQRFLNVTNFVRSMFWCFSVVIFLKCKILMIQVSGFRFRH